jgi:hypothetical protein
MGTAFSNGLNENEGLFSTGLDGDWLFYMS